jgi:predicted DNA-binding WGR domain protein
MSAVTLRRIDATRRMSRFYRLDVSPTCSGSGVSCGNGAASAEADKMRETPHPTPAEAEAALERQRQAKERRGYTLLSSCGIQGKAFTEFYRLTHIAAKS